MKESDREGITNHSDPESCVDAREGGREALTGADAGEPLSREIKATGAADAVKRSGRPHCGMR